MLVPVFETQVPSCFCVAYFFISYQENKAIQRELSTSSESLDDGTIERHVRCICLYFPVILDKCFVCLKSKKNQTNNIFNWYIRADWLFIVFLIFCVRRGWAHSEVTMKTCSPTRKMPGKRHGGSTRCTNLPQERNDCLFLRERLFISISHGSATCRYPSSSHTDCHVPIASYPDAQHNLWRCQLAKPSLTHNRHFGIRGWSAKSSF